MLDAISGAMTSDCANLGGHFGQSRQAGEIIDAAHAKAAMFLGAASPDEIAIGPSMTGLIASVDRVSSGERSRYRRFRGRRLI